MTDQYKELYEGLYPQYLDLLGEKTNFEKVKEFYKAFGLPHSETPYLPPDEVIDLRLELINEEVEELEKEFPTIFIPNQGWFFSHENISLQRIAKELADVLYVTYGMADALGIDVDRVFSEVHRSNMSKLSDDGKPVYREDGKVLKGENYKPPNLEFITS